MISSPHSQNETAEAGPCSEKVSHKAVSSSALWFPFKKEPSPLNLRANLYPCLSSAEIIKSMGLFPVPKNRAAKKTLWSKGCLQRPDRKAKSLPPRGSQGCVSLGWGHGATRALLCPSLPRAYALTSLCLTRLRLQSHQFCLPGLQGTG